MLENCSDLASVVRSLPLVESCDFVRSGALRVSTPFRYPNGEHVDVFLARKNSLFGSYSLTDLGQTSGYLRTALVSAIGTHRKREIVHDITTQLGVSFESGDLYIEVEERQLDDLADAILRLAQACVRVSDMATHQRLRSSNAFRDDVEDFFEAHKFKFQADVRIAGGFGKDVRMDFKVTTAERVSFVNVMAALSESSAHNSAVEIFSRWHDVARVGEWNKLNFVTIYNSASQAIREEDISRLREYSTVASYPDEEDFLATVLANDPRHGAL